MMHEYLHLKKIYIYYFLFSQYYRKDCKDFCSMVIQIEGEKLIVMNFKSQYAKYNSPFDYGLKLII